jgi:hypothetical protein
MPNPGGTQPAPDPPAAAHWFGAGIAVFHGSTAPADYPPLADPAAGRHWLGGFGAAWAECPPGAGGWCAQPLDVALMLALAARPALAARLCATACASAALH